MIRKRLDQLEKASAPVYPMAAMACPKLTPPPVPAFSQSTAQRSNAG